MPRRFLDMFPGWTRRSVSDSVWYANRHPCASMRTHSSKSSQKAMPSSKPPAARTRCVRATTVDITTVHRPARTAPSVGSPVEGLTPITVMGPETSGPNASASQ